MVADVWYLEPQKIGKGEKPEEFAARVQSMIANAAGMKAVDWNGYLK